MSSWPLRALFCFVIAGCALFDPPSKVKSGQLFEPGQAPYDDYFSKVHELQLEAANWPDAKKAARRNLIDELKLATDAPEVTIAQATHERMVAIAHTVGWTRLDLRDDDVWLVLANESRADDSVKEFIKTVTETIRAEIKREKEMRDVPPKCDDLAKVGRELEPRVKVDFAKNGGTAMADVHDELQASFEVLDQISNTARLGSRETEDFVSDLQRAVSASAREPLPASGASGGTSSGGDHAKPASTAAPPPPADSSAAPKPKHTPKPRPKPKPKPKPQGGGDEVFSP